MRFVNTTGEGMGSYDLFDGKTKVGEVRRVWGEHRIVWIGSLVEMVAHKEGDL